MITHAYYREKLASVYDRMYPFIEVDTGHTVDLLSRLVPPPARVLELGVGTGRLALPLADAGYRVRGIDGSAAMLARLKEKDPEGRVEVELADFTSSHTGGTYDLIFTVLNTFFSAVTREQQLGCLRLVREQLEPEGRFLMEVFEPTLFHGLDQPSFSVRHLGDKGVMLDMLSVDRSRQLMVGTHTVIDGGVPETTQHVVRYAFPSELDLLAELSGLRLVDRWGDFTGQPFTSASHRHVSVYARADHEPR
ncbi:class I SAM-dependent methyltransferase [Micromonospora olivasterospora]|uniref:Methyltransferase family protein n=1 Tax=Micromonospora olivasterospora TaxID=1880 RepID=A0A562IC75_MICOL|nr:class I SAM-dependent methyltransferase [Micromonospora olivasterospora]TWH68590.1 methyltransferase family protein [Micromonospora olivasterospora]